MRTKEKDILLALVAAQDQLLWTEDLLQTEELIPWGDLTSDEKIEQGTKEALKALRETLGIVALGVAVEEAEEHGYCDLCDELRRLTSCDHCPFNGKNGSCWISEIERQDEVSWQQAREKWMDEQGRKRVVVHGEVDENELPW